MKITVVVACRNANGSPDFFLTTVTLTIAEYEQGLHYDRACQDAEASGYEGPFVPFDERDASWLVDAVQRRSS